MLLGAVNTCFSLYGIFAIQGKEGVENNFKK